MIKAKTTGPDGAAGYIFGLSERNIQLLKAGKPIVIDLAELGGRGSIMLMYGKTENDITRELMPFLSKETKITVDPQQGGKKN